MPHIDFMRLQLFGLVIVVGVMYSIFHSLGISLAPLADLVK